MKLQKGVVLEEPELFVKFRFQDIKSALEFQTKEYGVFAEEAYCLVAHYLAKYRPDRFLIFTGAVETPESSDHPLDVMGSLHGVQGCIASYMRRVHKGESEQIELDWYIHRALEIEAPKEVINDGFKVAQTKYPELYQRSLAILDTYFKNYRPDLIKFARPVQSVTKFQDNMDALDVMISVLWICQWLTKEEKGEDIRREMDTEIRKHFNLPPNMIPVMKEGGKKRRISHPFEIIEGGKD